MKSALRIGGACSLAAIVLGFAPPSPAAETKSVTAPDVVGLVRQLNDDDYHVRERATRKLITAGHVAVDAVSAAAGAGGLEVTIRAIDVLHQLGISDDVQTSDEAFEALQKLADSNITAASTRAVAALKVLQTGREARAIAKIKSLGGQITLEQIISVNNPWNAQLPGQWQGQIQRQFFIQPGGFGSVYRQQSAITIGPSWKGDVKSLRYLHRIYKISRVVFEGKQVTDAWIAQLAGAQNLTGLRLRGTRVTGASMKVIAGLENLTSLELFDTPIAKVELSNMKKLSLLRIKQRRPARIRLVNLPALETVDLSGQPVSSLQLERVEGVKTLSINLTSAGESDLSVLAATPNVTSLALLGERITDEQLAHVKSLKNLTQLSIKRARVTDKSMPVIASLASLQSLHLWYTPVTDAKLMELTKLKKLVDVKFYGTRVTAAGALALDEALPQARVDRRSGALLGVSGSTTGGPCLLSSVRPNSAAEKAGVKPGDVVTEFDGTPIGSFADLTLAISDKKGGNTVEMKLTRAGQNKITLKVTLGEWD